MNSDCSEASLFGTSILGAVYSVSILCRCHDAAVVLLPATGGSVIYLLVLACAIIVP